MARLNFSITDYFSSFSYNSSVLSALTAVTALSSSIYLYRFVSKWRNLPPGPIGLPVVGYIPFIPSNYESKIRELFKSYGKVFSLRLGSEDVVFVADIELLKQSLVQYDFNYRPASATSIKFFPTFLSAWNGEEWKEQRKFSLRVLRHLGLGKQEVEDAIIAELSELFASIDKDIKDPIAIHRRMGSSVSNIMTLLIIGHRYDYDHPVRVLIDDNFLVRGGGARPSILGYVGYMPLFSKILEILPSAKVKQFKERRQNVVKVIQDWIEAAKERKEYENTDSASNFIDAYLKEMYSDNHGKYFDEAHLMGCILALFNASTNTVGDFLTWFLLYMMVYPNVQTKMRDEITNVIGYNRPSTKDRDKMPYTQAVLQELFRIISISPSGLIHAVGNDCTLGKYRLPKGTHVVYAWFFVHSDPDLFENPNEFKPERFLTSDGKFIRDENVMPYGFGKRSCPGEAIGNTIVFLYIASFLQTFEIFTPPGLKYSTKSCIEFLGRHPVDAPIKVCFKRR